MSKSPACHPPAQLRTLRRNADQDSCTIPSRRACLDVRGDACDRTLADLFVIAISEIDQPARPPSYLLPLCTRHYMIASRRATYRQHNED